MVTVTVSRDDRGRITAMVVEGHAGAGPYGRDLVCAAASVLAQTLVAGLQKVAAVDPETVIREGYLSCRVEDPGLPGVQAVFETILAGFEGIEQSYSQIRIRKR